LTTLGGVAAFGRSAKILDRRQGTVTSWWGVLVPIRSTTRRLEEFCEVSQSREERTIDHSTYIVFPVRLKARDGKDFTLQESRKDGEARQAAKQFAKYLGLPLVDTTHGTP